MRSPSASNLGSSPPPASGFGGNLASFDGPAGMRNVGSFGGMGSGSGEGSAFMHAALGKATRPNPNTDNPVTTHHHPHHAYPKFPLAMDVLAHSPHRLGHGLAADAERAAIAAAAAAAAASTTTTTTTPNNHSHYTESASSSDQGNHPNFADMNGTTTTNTPGNINVHDHHHHELGDDPTTSTPPPTTTTSATTKRGPSDHGLSGSGSGGGLPPKSPIFNLETPVVAHFNECMRDPSCATAVAAIHALTKVIAGSAASTLMELQNELQVASDCLKTRDPTGIPLKAGCELFLRYVARTAAEATSSSLSSIKQTLIQRGRAFAQVSHQARHLIAENGRVFVHDGATVLVHGFSRVVLALLLHAAAEGRRFRVVATEGRPNELGANMARQLRAAGIPVEMILDAAVAYKMSMVSLVLVGAEAVVESGGIVNRLVTYQVALVAKVLHVPFYVACESYKFARIYPLGQRDVPREELHVPEFAMEDVEVDNPTRDYTPPHLIALLITDLGVLTPAAVSDELIQLYL